MKYFLKNEILIFLFLLDFIFDRDDQLQKVGQV
jgi:hypothetical protein